MLKWTVYTGATLVLAFNLDAFAIYRSLSTDTPARAAIEKQLQSTTATSYTSNADALTAIEQSLQTSNLDVAKTKVTELATSLETDFTALKDQDNAKMAGQIKAAVGTIAANPPEDGLHRLRQQQGELALLLFKLHKTGISQQAQGIAALDLPIGWTTDWPELKASAESLSTFLLKMLSKFGGLLLTIFLITFGAPFLNDILSALVGFKNNRKAASQTT